MVVGEDKVRTKIEGEKIRRNRALEENALRIYMNNIELITFEIVIVYFLDRPRFELFSSMREGKGNNLYYL